MVNEAGLVVKADAVASAETATTRNFMVGVRVVRGCCYDVVGG